MQINLRMSVKSCNFAGELSNWNTMKKFLLSIFTVLCTASMYAVSLNGVEYTIDTLSMYPVGPGTTYYELRFLRADNGKGRMDAFLIAVDTRNPYVHTHCLQ